MPSNEVLDGLAKLQTKLAELEPAIAHTKAAQEATSLVKLIAEAHKELMSDAEALLSSATAQNSEKMDALVAGMKVSHGHLMKALEAAPKSLEARLSENVASHQEQLINVGKVLEDGYKSAVKSNEAMLANAAAKHGQMAASLRETVKQEGEKLGALHTSLHTEAQSLQQSTGQFSELLRQLNDLHLPLRLDKMDATISAINIAGQNQLAFLEKLKSNVADSAKRFYWL